MKLSVIIPCFNEEVCLPVLIERVGAVFRSGGLLPEAGPAEAELLLVDDGSRDGTWGVIQRCQARAPFVVGLRHAQNQGIVAAWRTAAHAARGELVCILDADLQYQPEDILRLHAERARRQVDIMQGWRSPVGRERGARYYYSRGFNALLNLAFSMKLRDNKSGFLLTTREVFADLLRYQRRFRYWQSFIMVAAHYKGYSYGELEVRFLPRYGGASFLANHPLGAALKSFQEIFPALLEYRLRPSRGGP